MRWQTLIPLLLVLGCSGGGSSSSDTVCCGSAQFASGAGAGAYLLDGTFSSLLIEIDTAEGLSLDQVPFDKLEERILERCNKPGGISRDASGTIPSASLQATWELADLLALRSQFFGQPSAGSQAGLFVLVLSGSWQDDPNVVGVAFEDDAFALFSERLSSIPLLGQRRQVTESVLVHEFGHLLGLVGNAPHSGHLADQHEDPSSTVHDRGAGCVMFSSIQGGLTTPPDDFCGCCQLDLQAGGGQVAADTLCPVP